MNHWKVMGARSLAGVLTVGMLMGQPSLIWAADSAAHTSDVSAKEKVSDLSKDKDSVPEPSVPEKSDTGKADKEKPDEE
ncbi:MAG TPA: hypothetical protein DF613_00140, partial [Lachnospiraceae bacterium]|nr:hypothetical protein [Lachnospiraceae bacterium]